MDDKKSNFPRKLASRLFSVCGKTVETDSVTLISDLDYQKLEGEQEKIPLYDENSAKVDICFVLDCTGSMASHITAAKDCILKVVDYMERINPNIKLWVGLCGYRDHCDGSDRLQIFDFTDSYSKFKNYISNNVTAKGGGDAPEDVLGGLDAAVNKMKWSHNTRIILHLGDSPQHGRRFTDCTGDSYPDGDPNGLTPETVLGNIKSAGIHYYFGKITNSTDKMNQVFRDIIGEFLVFDLKTDGKDPKLLTTKLFEAVCSSITTSVTLTSTTNKVRQRKILEIDSREPDWITLSVKTGDLLHHHLPKSLVDIMNPEYFNKKNLLTQKFSYKQAPKPFSSGAEHYAYLALDFTNELTEKIVIKECINLGKQLERCLEMVEISSIAYFLSTEFNSAATRVGIDKKVNFLKSQALRYSANLFSRYYTVEPKLQEAKFKRFNVNSGKIKEYHSILEAFAHFTYEYTGGYLLVYDLQGIELADQFILTDSAIQCMDRSRFGRTNLGKRGIEDCFLRNHKCDSLCQKLGLAKIQISESTK